MRPAGIAMIRLELWAEGEEKEILSRDLVAREVAPSVEVIASVVEEEVRAKTARWQAERAAADPRVVAVLGEYLGGPPISEIFCLWERHKGNRKALKHFRDAAAFLRVQLAGMDFKKDE